MSQVELQALDTVKIGIVSISDRASSGSPDSLEAFARLPTDLGLDCRFCLQRPYLVVLFVLVTQISKQAIWA